MLCWALSQAIYFITGDGLAVGYYFLADAFVIAVVGVKAVGAQGLRNTDLAVLLIFPLLWVLYVAPVPSLYQYWSLYSLFVAQLAAAGWEAMHPNPSEYAEICDLNDTRLMCQAAHEHG